MRVTVFNGSPRGRASNSHRIIEPLLEGARQAGAQTEEVFLVERNIEYCRGCFGCWTKTPGQCVIDDEMHELLELYLESDYVGLATPVYSMYMTALLKNFTDRLLPLATPHIHWAGDGSFYHKGRFRKYPRTFYVVNSGFPGKHNFDLFKAVAAIQSPVLQIYRNSGEVLSDAFAARIPAVAAFYDALRDAGREMVTSGRVSDETVSRLHAELISEEDYMAGANQHFDEEISKARPQG